MASVVRSTAAPGPAQGSALARPERAWVALAALLAAGWPVFAWLGRRFADGTELIPSALAAALAAGLVLRAPPAPRSARGRTPWTVPTLGVALYAIALVWSAPLVQAVCWLIALAATLRCVRLQAGDSGWLAVLLVLALPAVPSLQFFLGYPLRRLVTAATAALLRLEGLGVRASGAVLELGSERVVVDAPCSGVQMLWTSLLLAAACGGWHRLPLRSGALLLVAAALAAVLANVLRAAALFHWETRPPSWDLPDSTHAGIGLVAFAFAALAIVALGNRLSPPCAPS